MIRVAVVGVNHIGSKHCEVYRQNPDTELVAVCDLMPERAKQAAEQFDTAGFTSLTALLQEKDVDLVSIATSGPEGGGHHYEPAMIAIEAGKDVLVEKPISNDIEQARELVARAKQKGVRLACDLNHRFVPTADKAKELVESGQLGQILFVHMKLTIQNPNETSPWFHMRALHSHSIDVVRHFAGDIRRVQAFMTKGPGRNTWSTVSLNLEFVSGAVGSLTGSYDMSMRHPIEFCEVAGHKGRFVIDNVYDSLTFYPHDSDELLVMRNSIMGGVGHFDETIRNRIHHLIRQISDGVAPDKIAGSGADALAAQEVIEAAIRSHTENGAPIEVRPVD
ncbi:Gfo/Idh/MocA family protein [Alicyclobacillus fodiniaquatilis]|jgi:predicted dehydrogenase|uniref:Gfo/Idh/MocA family protein n=1 Tax=Alicyclobacillus fodiniaquatilis TaxID=1661150 RepID=A0ABW4JJN5_9BACL